MKKMMILAVMMVMTISANAMSYNAAKHEALFLSDKMAYELNLTAAQYEAVYEINLDYLMSLAVMMVMTISANAMSYNAAKHEALFLSDRVFCNSM